MSTATPVIGRDLPRRDATDKLRGRTRYVIDRRERGTLYSAFRRAEVAAGRITKLDSSPALAVPGVRGLITASDAPGRYGVGIADHPLFADGVVRFYGEPLVLVAADTAAAAQAGADAVVVEIDELEPLVTMAAALAPDARLIHPDWENYDVLIPADEARAGNVAWEATSMRGDVDAAFARPDVRIVEGRYISGRQNQASFEPRVAIGRYEDGRYNVETSTQHPWACRTAIARHLGVPPALVRVTVPPSVGGGFGQKFEPSIESFAALLARKVGRPVMVEMTREEEMRTALARENAEIFIRSAIDSAGEIVGREAVVLMDCGAYAGEQTFLTSMITHTLMGNYRLGAQRLVARAIYTNTAPTGAFRACSGTYATYALERHSDEICAAIGVDRIAFRRRNVIGDGDLSSTGPPMEGDVLGPMLDRMDAIRQTAAKRVAPEGWLSGRATVVGTWFIFVAPSAATVNLNADGSATLVTAGVEIGSGSLVQSLPQIVADRLGIEPEQVIVKAADTDAAGYDGGVGGGRTTVSLGAAATEAANGIRSKVLDYAAELLEVATADLVLADGGVAVIGDPTTKIAIAEIAAHAMTNSGPLGATGAFTAPGLQPLPGCATGHMIGALDLPVFAVHDVDVAVDPATGRIEVLAYRVVQDVGRAINPRACRYQIQGGVIQGLGYAIHEEITIGADGRICQAGFETYRLPLAGDGLEVAIDLYEGAPSIGPLGAKGAGEVPILNVAAAIACAVADATGIAAAQIPLTPARVLGEIAARERPPTLDHISPVWRNNVITDLKS